MVNKKLLLNLFDIVIKNKPIENTNDPLYQLFSKNSIDNKKIILGDKGIIFIYFNRKKIEKILYEEEEFIVFNYNSKFISNSKISDYFYLSLLIRENTNIINYVYSFNLIQKLNNASKNNKNGFKSIIISKIIIELIDNYKGSEYYKENEKKEINKIIEENVNNIEKNIIIFKNLKIMLTLEDIQKKKLDEIYAEIIKELIIQYKFNDYEYTKDIFCQLDLENINITKTMFDSISQLFNSKEEEFIKKYSITKGEDLKNKSKIDFYSLLFEFIFKNSIYIYQNRFLTKIKRNLIQIIKSQKELLRYIDSKTEKVINIFLDSDYYISEKYTKKYHNEEESNRDISTRFSNNIQNNKKSLDNNINLEFNKNESIKKILIYSSFVINNTEEGDIKFFLIDDEKGEQKTEDLQNFEDISDDTQILEENFKKYLEFLYTVKERLKEDFKNNYNLVIKLELFLDEGEYKGSNSLYNIYSKYSYYPPNEGELLCFKDDNILINGVESNSQGYFFLTEDINDSNYKNIKYNQNLNPLEIIKNKEKLEKILKVKKAEEEKKEKEKEKEKEKILLYEIFKPEDVSKYEIIKFKSIIATHSHSAEFVKSLNNFYYISGGNNKEIYIYNQQLKKIKEINLSNQLNGICPIKYHDNKYNIKFAAFSNKQIEIISYNPKINIFNIDYSCNSYAYNILEVANNKYIISNADGTFITNDLRFSNEINKLQKILDYSYRAAIKINDNIIAFTSNEILSNGKDRIVLYNHSINQIENVLGEYSFSLCSNSLLLLDNKESCNDEKILLCACKKYISYQNNGILLVFINLRNKEFSDIFYKTDFEPYCFSPISYVLKSKDNTKNVYNTNYILVGGFDPERCSSVIKLYKVKFEYNNHRTTIENKENIIIENEKNNFYGIKGAVTCITQNMDNGNFLITSSDGKVLNFSAANINYFLYNDEQDKNKVDYEESTDYIENKNKNENDNITKQINKKQIFSELIAIFKNLITFDLSFLS